MDLLFLEQYNLHSTDVPARAYKQRSGHPLACLVVNKVLGCLLRYRLSRLSYPALWSGLISEDWTEGSEGS